MNKFAVYAFESAICMGVLYLVYLVFFRKNSMFSVNRFFLLFSLVFSIIVPFVEIDYQPIAPGIKTFYLVADEGYVMEKFLQLNQSAHEIKQVNYSSFIWGLYFVVAMLLFIRMVFSLLGLWRLVRNQQVDKHRPYYMILTEKVHEPFSFFRWIFIPPGMDISGKAAPVFLHEKAHADQFHSLDLIFTEILMVVFWFNPFVFLYRGSLRLIHEYTADKAVLKSGYSSVEYLTRMLDLSHRKMSVLTSNFNSSITKKRVKMIINNSKNQGRKGLYLLSLPVLVMLVMAFSGKHNRPGNNPVPHLFPVSGASMNEVTVTFGKVFINPVTNKEVTHNGIDIKSPSGTPVIATGDGIVILVSENESRGKHVVIQHGTDYQTWYTHLESILVAEGDKLEGGDQLGKVGNTGYSTGPHLHYEVVKEGERVNPEEYFGL